VRGSPSWANCLRLGLFADSPCRISSRLDISVPRMSRSTQTSFTRIDHPGRTAAELSWRNQAIMLKTRARFGGPKKVARPKRSLDGTEGAYAKHSTSLESVRQVGHCQKCGSRKRFAHDDCCYRRYHSLNPAGPPKGVLRRTALSVSLLGVSHEQGTELVVGVNRR
jgi:hypothetical protein